jgi:DNA mismatch repair protein MutS
VIAELEERERARTGINSLKVRYNRVFGLLHRDLEIEPARGSRATITASRRLPAASASLRPALKEYEEKVLGADDRILEREVELSRTLRERVAAEATRIQDTARALATLDVLAGLADTAAVSNYIKPHMHDSDELVIGDGRHPVGRTACNGAFVPNDTSLTALEPARDSHGPEHGRQVTRTSGRPRSSV